MLKEHGYLASAVAVSMLAGYGAMALWWRFIAASPAGDALPLGLLVGFGALALLIRGHSAIRAERLRHTFKI